MMSPSQRSTDCQPERLARFLAGSVSAEETQKIERHLNVCRDCQQHIERSAANAESWNKASEFLNTKTDAPDVTRAIGMLMTGPASQFSTRLIEQSTTHQATLEYLRCWLREEEGSQCIGRLAQYEVTDLVGRGGMGLVLKARDTSLDRTVAIKTLAPHLVDHHKARADFFREATLAASLRHPHLIEIYSVDTWDGIPYLVMPFFSGALHSHCADRTLSLMEILSVTRQIAEGLAAIHARDLVHRDIKPSNVLLEDDMDSVVISDFGLARAADGQAVTMTGMLAGTPAFMSPEQARGEKIDGRSDIFSLGSLMYWLAAGRTPFEAENSYGTIRGIVEQPHNPVLNCRPDLPSWFDQLLNRMLIKDRDSRRDTAAEIADRLAQCLGHCQNPSQTPLPSVLRQSRWKRPGTIAAAIGGMAGTILLAFAVSTSSSSTPFTPATTVGQEDAPAVVGETEVPYAETRTGPLDALDLLNLESDFEKNVRLEYWLRRLVELPADQVPAKVIDQLETLSESDDPEVRRLVAEILRKNPFQEVGTD